MRTQFIIYYFDTEGQADNIYKWKQLASLFIILSETWQAGNEMKK